MATTIAGLVITLLVSIEGTFSSDRKPVSKLLLVALALTGFAIATWAAINQSRDAAEARANEETVRASLQRTEQTVTQQAGELLVARRLLGDLAALNDLSGNGKYYVRITTSNNRNDLIEFRDRIYGQFQGAKEGKHVKIRSRLTKNKTCYHELVFGSGLDVAAAEVFFRLANAHHFPRPGDIPWIQREPDADELRLLEQGICEQAGS